AVVLYLDSSVVLRVLFRQRQTLAGWGRWQRAYASELLGIEARRAIDRLRLEGSLDDAGVADAHDELARIEEALDRLPLAAPVLARAALPMPTVVKTLDAIHLATAMLLREQRADIVSFATHDPQQARGA